MVTANNLDEYLRKDDKKFLSELNTLYEKALHYMQQLDRNPSSSREELIQIYGEMGVLMQELVAKETNINVYSFKTPRPLHGEASYLIAKLRDKLTGRQEFIYYIQRAYELLFNLAYNNPAQSEKNHLIVPTPVQEPCQNYAVHKIPNIDSQITSTAMCVMLRGALLPSMIMSKSIEEYSSTNHITPFSLFKIQRKEGKNESDIRYVLDLNASFFHPEDLQDKDLIFADPMNATGGSFATVVRYLYDQHIRPRSIKFFTVISTIKGTLRILRAFSNVRIYTIWMDPALNESAYIMPGLGDAGDRLNGEDMPNLGRNIIQLIADYGASICNLYRSQVRAIERTVL